jgi:hypothetical protein
METRRVRDKERGAEPIDLGRRTLLHGALAAGGVLGMAAVLPVEAFARHQPGGGARVAPPSSTLTLARFLNKTKYSNLPPKAIDHAKMILASTLASAASGSLIGSARILRDLAKEHGGRPEATVWFDGTKLPAHEVARVNAVLSDAAASDDSDIRNTAHHGTALASASLAIAEHTGATGQDLLLAMVIGYEAGGRIGDARRDGRGGVHASQIVAFGGAVAAAKLLKLTDEQMAHALGITAITMGGLSTGTDSWARVGPCDGGEDLQPGRDTAHGFGGSRSSATGGHLRLEVGRNGDDRDQDGGQVHQHRRCAPWLRAARHRVERRRCQVPCAHARLEVSGDAHRGQLASDSWLREGEERFRADTPDRTNELRAGPSLMF